MALQVQCWVYTRVHVTGAVADLLLLQQHSTGLLSDMYSMVNYTQLPKDLVQLLAVLVDGKPMLLCVHLQLVCTL